MCARENKTAGAGSGYGCRTLETLGGETSLEYNNTGRCKDNIMQVPLEVLRGRWLHKQQRSKTERVQWVGPPYPSRGRRSRINLLGLVQQAHTGIDTTGVRTYLAGVHLEIGYSQYKCTYNSIMIMSRKNRKLDRLKMYSKGATNETTTCAVPMHAPQTSPCW